MTEFELLAIPISLVLGLGITKMLSALAIAIGTASKSGSTGCR